MLLLYSVLAVAMVTDLKEYRIPNILIAAGGILGMLYVLTEKGPPELLYSLIRVPVVIAAMLPLYFMKALGAGDVKLFGVTALFMGVAQIFKTLLVAMIIGVVFGLIKILIICISKKYHKEKPNNRIIDNNKTRKISSSTIVIINNILQKAGMFRLSSFVCRMGEYTSLHIIHFCPAIAAAVVLVAEGLV